MLQIIRRHLYSIQVRMKNEWLVVKNGNGINRCLQSYNGQAIYMSDRLQCTHLEVRPTELKVNMSIGLCWQSHADHFFHFHVSENCTILIFFHKNTSLEKNEGFCNNFEYIHFNTGSFTKIKHKFPTLIKLFTVCWAYSFAFINLQI